MRRAISSATALLPDAVGPKIARTSSAKQTRARELEIALAHAGGLEVSLDAPVAALELVEDAADHPGRRLHEPLQPAPFGLGLRRLQPPGLSRPEAFLAEGVIGRDVVRRHPRHVQQESRHQPGSILAADALDDDAPLGSFRDRPYRGSDVGLEALEEEDVAVACCLDDVGHLRKTFELLADLLPLLLARFHERHVPHVDRKLPRWVVLALVVAAKVDHGADAVIRDGLPALGGEVPDAVCAHDRAEARLAFGGRMAAEVADVEAAVPDEIATTQQRPRARRLGGSSTWRLRSGPERGPPLRPSPRRRPSCSAACGRAGTTDRSGSGPRRAPPRPRRPGQRSAPPRPAGRPRSAARSVRA